MLKLNLKGRIMSRYPLKARMLASICSVTLISSVLSITFSAMKAREMVKEDALEKLSELAYRHAGEVKVKLDGIYAASRSLISAVDAYQNTGNPSRAMVRNILHDVLAGNPDSIGSWINYAPDSFDGKDAEWAGKNQLGNTPKGTFCPYFARNGAAIELQQAEREYEEFSTYDYYSVPVKTDRGILVEPYAYSVNGVKTLITSAVFPVHMKGKAVASGGMNISLGDLSTWITTIQPYETGFAYLLSSGGNIVAHPDTTLIGKAGTEADLTQEALTAVLAGTPYRTYQPAVGGREYVMEYVPIPVGDTGASWSLVIAAPMDRILARAQTTMISNIMIGGASLLVLIVVVFIIASGIATPISLIASDLNLGVERVHSAMGQFSESSQRLAEGASEQAASLEEISSSIEEISSMISLNSSNAREANTMAAEAQHAAEGTTAAMDRMSQAIGRIKVSSDETARILKTIDEIAFQTNLLALNAAVEAARAGDAGRGFAVVAEEVRNLAQRSAGAAKETANLIAESQHNANSGVSGAAEVSNVLSKISATVDKVAQLISEVATATDEQAGGISQINEAVIQMDVVTQANAASAEETAAASQELSDQSKEINTLAGKLMGLIQGSRHS